MICKGCHRYITPSPDANMIRLYWVCTNWMCDELNRHQKVMWAQEFYEQNNRSKDELGS